MRACAEAALAALAAALAACSTASPETEVREALARQGPVRVAGAAGEDAALERVRFADVTVSMDGPRALVLAVADADGRLRSSAGDAALSYVGREAFAMVRCPSARWCAADGALPVLRSVLAALPELRARTAAAAAPPPHAVRDLAWQIRVERERALVGEDYALAGSPDARPLRARRELVRGGGGDGWRLAPGP